MECFLCLLSWLLPGLVCLEECQAFLGASHSAWPNHHALEAGQCDPFLSFLRPTGSRPCSPPSSYGQRRPPGRDRRRESASKATSHIGRERQNFRGVDQQPCGLLRDGSEPHGSASAGNEVWKGKGMGLERRGDGGLDGRGDGLLAEGMGFRRERRMGQ